MAQHRNPGSGLRSNYYEIIYSHNQAPIPSNLQVNTYLKTLSLYIRGKKLGSIVKYLEAWSPKLKEVGKLDKVERSCNIQWKGGITLIHGNHLSMLCTAKQ